MARILVIFSSLFGANADLAQRVAAELTDQGAEVRVRGVRQIVLAELEVAAAKAAPEASAEDLAWADGFLFTSPSHTGLPSAAIKAFIDDNHDAAVAGQYLDRSFTAMATGAFAHAGQERVVDDLNAVGAAWGCLVVAPSTADAELNLDDGNPYGLSFVLDHGKLPQGAALPAALRSHLRRFATVTDVLAQARAAGRLGTPPRSQSRGGGARRAGGPSTIADALSGP